MLIFETNQTEEKQVGKGWFNLSLDAYDHGTLAIVLFGTASCRNPTTREHAKTIDSGEGNSKGLLQKYIAHSPFENVWLAVYHKNGIIPLAIS